jgi:hypothetical protein
LLEQQPTGHGAHISQLQLVGSGDTHAALSGIGTEMQGSDAVELDHLYNAVIIVALVDQSAIIFVHKRLLVFNGLIIIQVNNVQRVGGAGI